MAGQLKVNGVTLATEESGTVTLEAPQIKDSSNNVILDQSGTNPVLKNVEVVNNSSMMFRNKIINGDMQIAQRGNSTSVSASTYAACDRYKFVITNGGTWSISQSTDSPDGFGSSYKIECTTSKSSLDSDSRLLIVQSIEGQNLQDLKKGTSSSRSLTLSFYVKTSLAGTYQVNLEDNDNIRIIGNTYTISSGEVNTWQYKEFTFLGDTTGLLDNDNLDSLALHFVLVAGSDNSSGSLPTSWKAKSNIDRGAGLTVNLAQTVGNTWQITGVQLEKGTVATQFEHRPYGTELALCQRYYEELKLQNLLTHLVSGYSNQLTIYYKVEKRATPILNNPVCSNFQPGGSSGTTSAILISKNSATLNSGSNDTSFQVKFYNSVLTLTIESEL